MWAQATRRFATSARTSLSSSSTARSFPVASQIGRSSLSASLSQRSTPALSAALLGSQSALTNSTKPAGVTKPCLPLMSQNRTLFDWALRPYAISKAASAATGLTTLNAGFSNVGLSLLVAPWKALPCVLAIAPMMYAVPALYKLLFSNCSRGAINSVFSGFCQFTLVFLPVPAYENLFAELTFYITALCLTFFMYNFIPELMLEDSIWIFYSALFVMPFLPLAFAYLPTFAPRSYLIL